MKEPQITITINLSYSQLPEILTRLIAEPVINTIVKPIIPEVEKPSEEPPHKKSKVSTKPRACIICSAEFLPKSNAQKKCSACKSKKVDKRAELDKTLKEIEDKRKEPYKISN